MPLTEFNGSTSARRWLRKHAVDLQDFSDEEWVQSVIGWLIGDAMDWAINDTDVYAIMEKDSITAEDKALFMKLFEKKYPEKNAAVHVTNTQKDLDQSNAEDIHELEKAPSVSTPVITASVSSITPASSAPKLACDLAPGPLETSTPEAFTDMGLLSDLEGIRQAEHETLKDYYIRVHSVLLLIGGRDYSIDSPLNSMEAAILLYIVKKFINGLLDVRVKNKLSAQVSKLKNPSLYKASITAYRLSEHWRLKSVKQAEEEAIERAIRRANEKAERKDIRKAKEEAEQHAIMIELGLIDAAPVRPSDSIPIGPPTVDIASPSSHVDLAPKTSMMPPNEDIATVQSTHEAIDQSDAQDFDDLARSLSISDATATTIDTETSAPTTDTLNTARASLPPVFACDLAPPLVSASVQASDSALGSVFHSALDSAFDSAVDSASNSASIDIPTSDTDESEDEIIASGPCKWISHENSASHFVLPSLPIIDVDSNLNIDFSTYQTDFCVGEQAAPASSMVFALPAIDIDVSMGINFEAFNTESSTSDTTTTMDMSSDVTPIEINSDIVICNTKACLPVDAPPPPPASDITCGPPEVVISASDIQDLNHITSCSPHYFSSGHGFVILISMLYFFTYLWNNKLPLANRKPPIKDHYKGRPKVKIKALKNTTPWLGFQWVYEDFNARHITCPFHLRCWAFLPAIFYVFEASITRFSKQRAIRIFRTCKAATWKTLQMLIVSMEQSLSTSYLLCQRGFSYKILEAASGAILHVARKALQQALSKASKGVQLQRIRTGEHYPIETSTKQHIKRPLCV